MANDITVFQTITLAIAVLGAVLGLVNTWHSLDKSRVKLRIVPAHAIPYGAMDDRLRFCIEITNLSAFPVTVFEAGVFFYGTTERGAFIKPVFADGGQWPKRLEPRTSISLYHQIPEPRDGRRMKCAYARTQCGCTQTGVSPALKQIAQHSNR